MARGRGGSSPRTGSGDYMFPAGAEVEVRSNEEGFRGVWYVANIVRHKPRRHCYEVIYSLLVDDNNPSHPLRELARRSNIRPRPPPISQAHYSLNDLVEAFHNDGWWSGVVAALFPGPPSTAYLVAFPTCREEHAFEASYLRPQLHWRSRDWIPAVAQQGANGPPFSLGARVEVSRIRDNYGAAWFAAIVLKILNSNTFLVEYENLQAGIGSDLLTEYVDAQYIRTYPPNAVQKRNFDIYDEVEVLYYGGWAPGKISKVDGSQFVVKLIHRDKEIQFGHDQMRPAPFWNGKEWVFEFQRKNKRLQSRSTQRSTRRSTRIKWKSQIGKRCSPILVSLSSDEGEHTRESGSVKSTSLESLQPCKNIKTMLLEYNNTPECNLLVDCPSTSMAEIDQCTSMKIIENNSSREQHHSEGILPPYVLQDNPLYQHQLLDVGEVVAEIQRETPLGTTIDDAGVLIVPRPSEPQESEILLPFSRTSAMWETIESMEVFRLMPQNPHFRLLEQHSMEFREGMAIGLMVSFANLATNIKSLHINDAQYTLKERMRALVFLEENGFDVSQLRSWLQKLLELHHNRRQFETIKASIEAKIIEKKTDNDRLQLSITSVDKTIMELEQNLTSAHKTKDSDILQKSLNDAEISKLEMSIREIEKSLNSTEASFRDI